MADTAKPVDPRFHSPPSWLFGAGAAAIALFFYLITTAGIAYPGRSLDILMNYGKIKGIQPLFYPLYESFAGLLAWLPGNLPLKMGIFSALCAWGALTFLFTFLSRVIYRTIEEEMDIRIRWIASLGAGLAAVAFLAFCKPFWYAANRADYACFHLMLLLGMARLFLYWIENMNKDWALALFTFLYGVGCTEFATFIVFAPLFALTLLVMLAIAGRLSTFRISLLALCSFAGLSLYGWMAYRYYHAPYTAAPASSVFEAFVFIAKGQFSMIMRSLPPVGWLMVGITTFIPWIILLPLHRRGLRSETGWSFIGLHVGFSLLVGALLFDFTLSPFRLMGEGRLLVTPYVCAAMVFGYLVAFWVVEENNPWSQAKSGKLETFRKRLCRVMAIVLAVAVVVPIGLHFKFANVRQARVFDYVSRNIITTMGDRTWLVTDGVLDNYILLAAKDMKKDIRLMDLSRAEDKRHMKEIADQFDSIRLKNQAELGLVPFIQEWMRLDPAVDEKLALMTLSDLWYSSDRIPIPYGMIFLGYRDASKVDVEWLRQRNKEFWSKAQKMAPLSGTPTALGMWYYFNRQMSLMANNTGVLLEDAGKQDEAYATYGLSRSMESNNLSALLNQYALIKGGYKAPDAEAVSNQLAKIESEALRGFNIWALSRYYGYVRAPEAFAAMGWTWALSGYPGMAVSGLKRALTLSSNSKVSDDVESALASVYMAQGMGDESRAMYTRILERDRNDVRALLGMAELALRWKKPQEARQYIERAESAGATRAEVSQAWALYHMAVGENDKARVFLEELTATYSGMTTPWHMLANVLVVQKDQKAMEKLAKQIRDLPRQDFHTSRALAIAAAMKDDGAAMRQYLDQALLYKPRDLSTFDLLLRMDMKEGRQDLAEMHAQEILRVRPDHPYANYVMGTMQMKRRDYKLAEDSLSRSLAEQRSPETLNDLAWAVLMAGRPEDAEPLVKEALAKNNQIATAWDTLGMIYLKQGKLDQARESIQKALNLQPKMPEFQVHLAEVEMAAKNYKSADELLQKAMPYADRMWVEEREKLQRLSRELRDAVK